MFRTPVLDIYVTGVCNLDCAYCFGEFDTKPGMERDTFRQALNFAHFTCASIVELCGGEPLLFRDLEWAVEQARSEGFGLILRTNGHLVSERRSFIAENFASVGISLDGDSAANDRMRPFKGRRQVSAEAKFEIPLQEVAALKELNPKLRLILASVATAENLDGLRALGDVLLTRKLPLDLWKIHQFVSNNFKSIDNKDRFSISDADFAALEHDLRVKIGNAFPTSCRRSSDIDGSCLIINRDGDVCLGARQFGNVAKHAFKEICARLEASDAELQISTNKAATYRTVIPAARRT